MDGLLIKALAAAKKLTFSALFRATFIISGVTASYAQEEQSPVPQASFQQWLQEFAAEAAERGVGPETIDQVLENVELLPRVIELDRRQPEFTQTFWAYVNGRVSENRIRQGKRLLTEHAALLREIEDKYGVQGRFLVAFWGLETNFGQFLGGFSVIDALATLAYDERRSAFFRAELFDALGVIESGHIKREKMVGSWAGAMGQPQFMPSTFARYAVDEDGDGRKDIWGALPDVFGSAANYLSKLGWDNQYTWGREVRLPEQFDLDLADLRLKKPLDEWNTLGIKRMDKRALPSADIEASLILPAGHKGPAFLVYNNFEAILSWNRSLLYAVSVGHLADRLVSLGSLQSKRHEERPLSRDQVTTLQERLNTLGHDAGEPDGQAGPRTRAAVKSFQKTQNLPADGYPDGTVFDAIMALDNTPDTQP